MDDIEFYEEYLVDESREHINNCNYSEVAESFKWNDATTKFFLNKYLEKKEDFRNPKIKKRTLWTDIMNKMREAGIEAPSEEVLDRKMRNLKKTYKNIKDNNNKTGRGRISWDYFEIFEEIFSNDSTINLSSSISSMAHSISTTEELTLGEDASPLSSESTSTSTSTNGTSAAPSTSRAARKRQSTLDCYRKKQLALEEKKVESLNKLTNEISLMRQSIDEKNKLLKELFNKNK